MKAPYALPLLALLGACVAAEAPPATPYRGPPPPRTYSTLGLERVMGQTARGLTTLFGAADAEVTEGASRKLQFGSRICVLDAYLYARGTGEPVVTHVDARQRDGSAIDRASCVAALSRREGGK
ncbi:hypothetical protein SAMN06297144_0117 [Sphingomonas guangdongensis]|uniref:UrcA family protein n=1 Tax=Sphingomonas guangdongensis TaxID=1141890 RepID=A0A285Q9V3_9SPHN|nr:hypothetical protein [Sphingomonas guangdongensis]SOB78611.1 hypothetical protein SAMN06297144_0117 [Sphingomonas guangdongensis]